MDSKPKIFDAAESTQLAAEDVVLYSQSLTRLKELQSGLDYRYDEGVNAGIAIGEQRGIAIGEQRGIAIGEKQGEKRGEERSRMNIARNMLAAGYDIHTISSITGLPYEKIERL